MNNGFFRTLANKRKLSEYIDVFDWLLDDNKFNNLNSKNKHNFTIMIKNYASQNNIDFREFTCDDAFEINSVMKKNEKYFLYESSNKAICLAVISNIRNSIAHGNCYIETKNGNILFIAQDFDRSKNLVSIIKIPLSMLKFLYETYYKIIKENINKEEKNNYNNKISVKM